MSDTRILTWLTPVSHVVTQNLRIVPKVGSARISMRSRCLLQYGYIGFRFVGYQCSLWLVVAIALLKLPFAARVEQIHVQVRYFKAIAKIDFVSVYGLLNDLLW